jgi:hypothetical protein
MAFFRNEIERLLSCLLRARQGSVNATHILHGTSAIFIETMAPTLDPPLNSLTLLILYRKGTYSPGEKSLEEV